LAPVETAFSCGAGISTQKYNCERMIILSHTKNEKIIIHNIFAKEEFSNQMAKIKKKDGFDKDKAKKYYYECSTNLHYREAVQSANRKTVSGSGHAIDNASPPGDVPILKPVFYELITGSKSRNAQKKLLSMPSLFKSSVKEVNEKYKLGLDRKPRKELLRYILALSVVYENEELLKYAINNGVEFKSIKNEALPRFVVSRCGARITNIVYPEFQRIAEMYQNKKILNLLKEANIN
tara:strand:+ start:52983 stop:53690 length:708 start_codon:yes stop_codon:yes gene_type:complete